MNHRRNLWACDCLALSANLVTKNQTLRLGFTLNLTHPHPSRTRSEEIVETITAVRLTKERELTVGADQAVIVGGKGLVGSRCPAGDLAQSLKVKFSLT